MKLDVLVGGRKREEVLEQARARISRHEQDQQSSSATGNLPEQSYERVEWEYSGEKNAGYKQRANFIDGQTRLLTAGFERYPSPYCAFNLILDGLEGKLPETYQPVFKDMMDHPFEWLDCAVKFDQENSTLSFLMQPDLIIERKTYAVGRFPRAWNSFHVPDLRYGDRNSLARLAEKSDDLIKWLYGRRFTELPVDIQKMGYLEIHYYTIWPLARSHLHGVVTPTINPGTRGVRTKPGLHDARHEGGI